MDLENLQIADPNTRKVLNVLIKQVLRNTQDLRMIKSEVLDTFITLKADPSMVALEEERAKTVEAQKNGTIKSEHFMAYLARAFLANVATRDIGQSNKTTMEAIMTELWDLDLDLVAEMFPGIYTEKVYEATQTRLLLGLHRFPHRAVIVSSLKQLDYSHKLGRPAAGYMEKQLSAAVSNLS